MRYVFASQRLLTSLLVVVLRFAAIDFGPLLMVSCGQEGRDRCSGPALPQKIYNLEKWPFPYAGERLFLFLDQAKNSEDNNG